MESFADTYFAQFRKTPLGMMRLDPQDFGPAYRNVIGLPGGTKSPLFPILQVRLPGAAAACLALLAAWAARACPWRLLSLLRLVCRCAPDLDGQAAPRRRAT